MKLNYKSQYKQDYFLDRIVFNKKSNGFFVDIGAHDGVTYSNSYFFEKNRNWRGVCIEPNPNVYKKLEKNRSSVNYNVCIGDKNAIVEFTQVEGYSEMLSGVTKEYHQNHLKRLNTEISESGGSINIIKSKMIRFDNIKDIKNKKIDFISIDTEGNELNIIKAIDFNEVDITCIVVENNYKNNEIENILLNYNFKLFTKLTTDDVFLNKNYLTIRIKYKLLIWKLKNNIKILIQVIKNKFFLNR